MQGQGQLILMEGTQGCGPVLQDVPPGAEMNRSSANGVQLFKQRC